MEKGSHIPPFKLDLTQRNTLSQQMTNALRQAIAAGRYQPGDQLPPIREWAKMLGVSIRVPEAVIARLAKEGLVIARPRHGCVVAPRNKGIFKGHVLLTVPPGDYVYSANIMCDRITRRLESAGYLVSRTTMPTEGRDKSDIARVNLALRQSVDLSVLVYEHPAIARAAKAAGVPFVWFGDSPPKYAVGSVRYSNDEAFLRFADHCRDTGVKSLEIITKSYAPNDVPFPFDAFSGMDIRQTPVHINGDAPRPGSIVTAASEAFCRRLSGSDPDLPDVFFFTDDYLFKGAMPALLKYGISIPDRLKLVTVSNYGNGPASPDPFDKIENNPIENGNAVSDALLTYLEEGRFPGPITLSSQYIPG